MREFIKKVLRNLKTEDAVKKQFICKDGDTITIEGTVQEGIASILQSICQKKQLVSG